MSKLIRSRLEKDFEFFVNSLPTLEPVEFIGLAKILSAPIVREEGLLHLDKELFEELTEEQRKDLLASALIPMDEILEKMMERYLELPKRRRKEINQILKEIKHDNMNKKVKKNGATT